MGKLLDKALAFVDERLPELVDDCFGQWGKWAKWTVIIFKLIVELCIEAELLANPLLLSLLFLFLLLVAIGCTVKESEAEGMAPKLCLWAASVACMVAPFWLGLCGSLFLAFWGYISEAKFKDPAVKWWIVFATHRSGLGSAIMPTGEMLYLSVASLACIFGSVKSSCIYSATVYGIALLFPDFSPIALCSIALLVLIGTMIALFRDVDGKTMSTNYSPPQIYKGNSMESSVEYSSVGEYGGVGYGGVGEYGSVEYTSVEYSVEDSSVEDSE